MLSNFRLEFVLVPFSAFLRILYPKSEQVRIISLKAV